MLRRTKVKEYSSYYGEPHVKFVTDHGTFVCSKEEWNQYELKQALIDSGADEKTVEALVRLTYSQGYKDAEIDHG